MNKIWTALAWLVLAGSVARAQAVYGTVRGIVIDSNGAPGAGARVTLARTAFAATADRDGRYELDRVPAGDYLLHARFADSSTFDVPIQVSAGGTAWRADTVASRADILASHSEFSGDLLERLPIDDPRQAFVLVPGVIERGSDVGIGAGAGLAIRGGTPGEASVFIDGAPVRFQTRGMQQIALGINGIADVAVTTGVPGILVGDARAGVIAYTTRSGGTRASGSLRADTDRPFGNGSSVGFNRFEAAAGGPVPGLAHLSWFLSGTLFGQSSQYRGIGAADQPAFTVGGADTTVQWVDGGSQSQSVILPQFVRSTGLRRPLDWSTLRSGQGKFVFTYGAGSSIAVTGLVSDQQQRFFPGQVIGDPSLYQGARASSGLVVLNWIHELRPLRGGPLTLSATLSLGTDRQRAGLLDPASETATRDPALGIEFSALHFTGQDSLPFPLNDRIIRNIRSNAGLRVPFLDRPDLRIRQPYRLNPYGLQFGWPTDGLDGLLTMVWERRFNGRLALDWRLGSHQVSFGTDLTRTSGSSYESALLRESGLDAFLAHPHRLGLFAGDRFELSHLVIDAGVRFDHFAPGGEFSNTPGRIFTDPAWSIGTDTSDAAYAASLAQVFRPTPSQGIWSPRVRIVYGMTRSTSIRFSYGRVVQEPPLDLYFKGSNADLSFTSIGNAFGRPIPYAVSTQFEIGVHYAPAPSLGVDVVGYSMGNPAPYAFRFQPFPDPAVPGDVINVSSLTSTDLGAETGIDARLDWSPLAILSGTLSYSFSHAPKGSTASSALFGNATTTHAVAALATLRTPADWQHGAIGGALFGDLSASILVHATSGLPFVLLRNAGVGFTAPPDFFNAFASPVGPARLPWSKTMDIRLTKGFQSGRFDTSLFADMRNVLNLTNLLGAYSETGATTNSLYREVLLSPEFAYLRIEASSNGALQGDGSTVDLRGCATWTAPPNCVALQRVEQRFGNGDGLYSRAEQTVAWDAYFDSFFGPWRFAAPGRTARLGLQIRF